MGSGAYSVVIDAPAGGGPSQSGRRVVPLPPNGFGGVHFTDVYLSLAYDDFGVAGEQAVNAEVRIIGPNATLLLKENVQIQSGRTVVAHLVGPLAAALTASVVTSPVGGHLPAVTALVEYTTP